MQQWNDYQNQDEDLNEYVRKESDDNDDEGREVEVGVGHQGGVHIVIQRLTISHYYFQLCFNLQFLLFLDWIDSHPD